MTENLDDLTMPEVRENLEELLAKVRGQIAKVIAEMSQSNSPTVTKRLSGELDGLRWAETQVSYTIHTAMRLRTAEQKARRG